MSEASEKVTVRIWASERVRYSKDVQMTRAEFAQFEEELDDAGVDDAPAERVIDRFIDRGSDWVDDGDYEIDTFEIVDPKEGE